jgi:hypothetical protein
MDFSLFAFALPAIAIFAFIGLAGLGAVAVLTHMSYAQILEKDPLDLIPLGGNVTTTLQDIDVAIDPTDGVLPLNGTLSIDTAGATDIDIQSMPAAGQTIVLTNTTATVTSNPVSIGTNVPGELESSDD